MGTGKAVNALTECTDAQLADMCAAGEEILQWYEVLGRTDDNIVGEVLRGQGTFYEWNHYPDGDVYDAETHAQYYYHAHPSGSRGSEHGHFHTFLRHKGMDARPLARAADDGPLPPSADRLSHLIAISMDTYGRPLRLFTTNRWVTGETWYAATDVCRHVERFAIRHARPSWPVNRWIGAMVCLFRPTVLALVQARDAAIAAWAATHQGGNVYEDRALEVASAVDVDVEAELAHVRRTLAERTGR